MSFRTGFHMVSSHQTRDLKCFAVCSDIPWNPPTNFLPDLIATTPQMSLLSLCALLFRHSHLFLICVVSTYNDARKDLHRLFQIPMSCRCKWLLVSSRVPRTFASSFVFPVKFWFCTDTPGSIGWLSPAPRLHIDDCCEIHNLLCYNQITKNFCTRYDSANASSARGSCDFGPLARNFTGLLLGLLGSCCLHG